MGCSYDYGSSLLCTVGARSARQAPVTVGEEMVTRPVVHALLLERDCCSKWMILAVRANVDIKTSHYFITNMLDESEGFY